MKNLKTMFFICLALVVSISAPAFAAGDIEGATTEEECKAAGGDWDSDGKKCDPEDGEE